jgi:hypothetical protein
MIDSTLDMSHAAVWLFLARKVFFMYVTPVILGFLVAVLFPIGSRFAAQHRPFWQIVGAAGVAPAVMLTGWAFVARALITAPLYGLGYGLGVALLSRVHTLTLWPPRVVTRQQVRQRIMGSDTIPVCSNQSSSRPSRPPQSLAPNPSSN